MGSSDHAERRVRLYFSGERFGMRRWSAVAERRRRVGDWGPVAGHRNGGYPHRHAPFRKLALWRAMRDHRLDQRTIEREKRRRDREIRETIHLDAEDQT